MPEILIVGAGIVGAALAERLASKGARVTIVDAGGGGASASASSFGWINASYYADIAHFNLRRAGMEAWHRLGQRVGLKTLVWQGCLSWEEPDHIPQQAASLRALGYPVAELSESEIAICEPALQELPKAALRFGGEGALEAQATTAHLLDAAYANGARSVMGQRVQSVLADEARAVGVETDAGLLMADHVVLAAGIGTAALLDPLGARLPMLSRPGDMLVTRPAPPMLSHVLVTPDREIRQDPSGRFHIPSTPRHEEITDAPEAFHLEAVAAASMDALGRYLPIDGLGWERVVRAQRPVPGDGLPVVGDTGIEGLSVAVMHSGVTLAAITAESLAAEILGHAEARHETLLAPYRLSRFPAKVL